jgi:hypothetical protein
LPAGNTSSNIKSSSCSAKCVVWYCEFSRLVL